MPKLKILVAEDSKSMQIFYQKELPEAFFEKRIVPDGAQALAEYEVWKPDIVLLDMNMPIMNGFQVLKSLRQEKNDQTITVIMMTSISEKEDVLACAKIGIQGYIVKPFKPHEMVQTILKCHRAHVKTAAA